MKRGRFVTNLAANLGFIVFSMAIAVWLTPYLIRHLGEAAYGLIPLAMAVTGYLEILTLALNSAVARFMTIALEQDNQETANRYFNTSLFGTIFLVLALVAPIVWAVVHIDMLIVIPEGQLLQTQWLFVCTAGVFLITALKTPFDVSTYCLNRFDLRNALQILQKFAYIGLLLTLFTFLPPRLSLVGTSLVAGAIVAWIGALGLWRFLTPSLRVSYAYFDKTSLKTLLSFGGWVSFNAIGSILFLGIDLLVVNRLVVSDANPNAGGQYAAVLQWSVLLRTIAGGIAGVFGPSILYLYARDDITGLTQYARRAVKCTGLMIALPVGLVCGLSKPLLMTWLPDFAHLSWLMSLLTIHLCVNLAITPLFFAQNATHNVRWPGIVTFIAGVGNLALALILAGPVGWGLYGVAAAGAIALTSKNLLFTPLYAAHYLQCRWATFFREVLVVVVATAGVVLIGMGVASTWDVSGWPRLCLTGTAISALYAACAYWGLLDAGDRAIFQRLLRRSGTSIPPDVPTDSEDTCA